MVDESDRDRLIKFLRMFSSDFDGEIATAARQAHKLLKARHLEWDDLIVRTTAGQRQDEQRQNQGAEEQYQDQSRHQHNHYQHQYQQYQQKPPTEEQIIARCARQSLHLNNFEREFLQSVGASLIQWGELTPKQRAVLDRIVTKLMMRGVY
jgi:hypothetical protein